MKKIVRKIAGYTLVIVIVDAVVISIALYTADSAGQPPLYYERKMPGFFGRIKEAYKDYVGELHLEQLFTTDLKHVIKKLGYKMPETLPERREVKQSEEVMPATLALSGFSLRYRDNAHRINLLEASVDGVRYDRENSSLSGFANVAFEGGDWSRIDGIEYLLKAQPVLSQEAGFAHGSESFSLEAGRGRAVVNIDLERMGLSAYKTVSVFLRGFLFDTGQAFPDGFNVKGISVDVTPMSRAGNNLELELTAEMKAGEVAFRKGPGYFYTTDARIFFTVIGTNKGTVKREGIHYMLLNRERAPEAVRTVKTNVGPGSGIVVPAIQGFKFDIHSTKARFLREVTLSVDDAEYDENTGEATALCSGYLSNDGTFPGALDVRFNANVLFIKLPDSVTGDLASVEGTMTDVTETRSIELNTRI